MLKLFYFKENMLSYDNACIIQLIHYTAHIIMTTMDSVRQSLGRQLPGTCVFLPLVANQRWGILLTSMDFILITLVTM